LRENPYTSKKNPLPDGRDSIVHRGRTAGKRCPGKGYIILPNKEIKKDIFTRRGKSRKDLRGGGNLERVGTG